MVRLKSIVDSFAKNSRISEKINYSDEIFKRHLSICKDNTYLANYYRFQTYI